MSTPTPAPRRTRLAAEILAEKARLKLTQANLSAATGIPLGAIGKILRGERSPDMDQTAAIAAVLGTTAAHLAEVYEAEPAAA